MDGFKFMVLSPWRTATVLGSSVRQRSKRRGKRASAVVKQCGRKYFTKMGSGRSEELDKGRGGKEHRYNLYRTKQLEQNILSEPRYHQAKPQLCQVFTYFADVQ